MVAAYVVVPTRSFRHLLKLKWKQKNLNIKLNVNFKLTLQRWRNLAYHFEAQIPWQFMYDCTTINVVF